MFKRLPAIALTALVLCLALAGCRAQLNNPEIWKTSFTGVWELDADVTDDKELSSEQLDAMKQSGMNCFFVLNEKGSCQMSLCGRTFKRGTWTCTNQTTAVLTFEDVTVQDEEAAQKRAEKAKRRSKDGASQDSDDSSEPAETFELTLTYHEDQLTLKVDKRGSLVFGRTTHVAMSDYLSATNAATEGLDLSQLDAESLNSLGRLLESLER